MLKYSCALFLACATMLVAAPNSGVPRKSQIANQFAQLPLRFEANAGQTDPRVKFLARGAGYTVFFTGTEVTLALPSSTLRMRLSEADSAAQTTGLDPLEGLSNYMRGDDPGKWHTNVQ